MALTYCQECGDKVSSAAVACPHCGHPVMGRAHREPTYVRVEPVRKWSPGIAAVLSLVIPGAGQMYKGQVFNGLAWLLVVVIGYIAFVIPGLVLHLFCIIGAASGDPTK